MKFSHSRSGRGRRRGRKRKLSAAEPRRGSVSVCVRVSVRVRGGSRGGLSAAHTHSTRRGDAPAHSTSPFSAARAGRKWPGLFSHCLGLPYLYFSRSLARSPVRARHKGHTGGGGRRGGARGSRLPPHRSAAPAAPAPPAGAPRLGGRARRPGCSSAAPTRARTPAEPGAAALPHPAPGVMKATKVTSPGGAGEGGPTRIPPPARRREPDAAVSPGSLPHGPPHPSPCARKEKIQVSPPPIFSFLFSLSFVPLSHSHSLLQSEMPRDSLSSRFRVTCPLFSPGLSFLLFPRGAEKWGRNPFCPFPSPDLFHKTRVRFLLSVGLLTFILTQKN